jgi:alpha-L-rhamnosidase
VFSNLFTLSHEEGLRLSALSPEKTEWKWEIRQIEPVLFGFACGILMMMTAQTKILSSGARKSLIFIFIFSSLSLFACQGCTASESTISESSTSQTSGEKQEKSDLPYLLQLDRVKNYKKSDWKAKWIWDDSCAANTYVAFRKSFALAARPASAIAHIAVESKYYLWVNSSLVVTDGGSKRGPTKYDSFYQDIDLKPYLSKGFNTIAVIAHYFGRNGFSSVDPGRAGFLFELDAGHQTIISDSSWKVRPLSEYKNYESLGNTGPDLNSSSYLAEWDTYFDANEKIENWTLPFFDDSSWKEATLIGETGTKPFNDLYQDFAPKIAFDQDVTDLEMANPYLNIIFPERKTLEIALPENMQFSPYFEVVSQKADSVISFYTDTFKTVDNITFKDYYQTKVGEQAYELLPWRTGSKIIFDIPAGIQFKRIGIRRSGYNAKAVGQFQSNDAELNALWNKAANTLRICTRDTYMDCPERERTPYVGDAAAQIEQTFYAFDSAGYQLTKKTILTMLGWTYSDFILPARSPTLAATRDIPLQNLAFLCSVYDYLLYSGDVETVSLFYPAAVTYLNLWKMDATTGLVVPRPSGTQNDGTSWGWYDWGEGIDYSVMSNSWYYFALKNTDAMAHALGFHQDDAFFEERMSLIKNHFDSAFLKAKGYATIEGSYDDRANGLAVVSGVASEASYNKVIALLDQIHQASPYMEKYVLEAQILLGYPEKAMARMLERYGPMITDSGTTLWEYWTKDAGTYNHGWSGGPLTLMSHYYAGIKPTKQGYEEYSITPTELLTNLSASANTPKGLISYKIEKNNSGVLWHITTIKSNGTLMIPSSFGVVTAIKGDKYEIRKTTAGLTTVSIFGGTYDIVIA